MPDSRDDSGCEYVNYVGCDPDCVDRTVPEGGDDYPVGTLSSEPFYVITDDMTSRRKLSGFSKLNTGNIQCLHVCSRV